MSVRQIETAQLVRLRKLIAKGDTTLRQLAREAYKQGKRIRVKAEPVR